MARVCFEEVDAEYEETRLKPFLAGITLMFWVTMVQQVYY